MPTMAWGAAATDEALKVVRDRSVPLIKRLEALRSVEVNDPEAGESINRELVVDDSDCPYFKLGVIQALRYRNPGVLWGEGSENGWLEQVDYAAHRALTDGRRTQPHFMVLGASKCGTSSLVRYLMAMPCIGFATRVGGQVDLESSQEKDCGFFDPMETHIFDFPPHQAPVDLMRAQCALYAPPAAELGPRLLGHYTPHYIFHPFTPHLVSNTFPTKEMAFIVLLREPVSRTVSSYKFKVATKREHRPFVQAMREGMQQHAALIARIRSSYAPAPAGGAAAAAQGVGGEQLEAPIACVEDTDADKTEAYTRLYFTEPGPGEPRLHEPVLFNEHVGKSIYYEQLRRWFDHFPRDRFYVCTLEDFSKDTVGEINQMLMHVGLPRAEAEAMRPHIEAVTKKRWNVTDEKRGGEGGGQGGGKEESSASKARDSSANEEEANVMQELRQFFKPHNERLYQLLGRRLWHD